MQRNEADLKSELCRTKFKLNEIESDRSNLQERYDALYQKFEQTSGAQCKLSEVKDELASLKDRYNTLIRTHEHTIVTLDTVQDQLKACQAEKAPPTHDLKKLTAQLRMKGLELEQVKQQLLEERSRVNFLTVQIQEMEEVQGRTGPLTTPNSGASGERSSRSTNMDEQSDSSLSISYYDQTSHSTSLGQQEPLTPQQENRVSEADIMDLSGIYPPAGRPSDRLLVSPPNNVAPNTPGKTLLVLPRIDAVNSNKRIKKDACVESISDTLKKWTFQSPLAPSVGETAANKTKRARKDTFGELSVEGAGTDTEEENLNLMSTTMVRDQSSWFQPTILQPDYVLVRLSTVLPKKGSKGAAGKVSNKHFVARVTGERRSGGVPLFRVDYFAKKNNSKFSGFYFVSKSGQVPKTFEYEIEQTQIAASLPNPDVGRRGELSFPSFNFDIFVMG